MPYDRRRGLRSPQVYSSYNAAIEGRHAGEANQRANAASQAYTDSTDLSTATRQADALVANESRAQQAKALENYYAQPEASRGPVGDYVAPRIASINPGGAMALTMDKDKQEEADFGTFLDTAQKDPNAALAFAQQKNIDLSPEMQSLVGNTYFTTQLNSAFKAAKAQYGGHPDLLQKAVKKASAEILGNLSAAHESGKAAPSGPMGYSLEGMPTAPRPHSKAPTRTDLLSYEKKINDMALEAAKLNNPTLWEEDTSYGFRADPAFIQKVKETKMDLLARFPPPGAPAAPATPAPVSPVYQQIPGGPPPPPAPGSPAAPAPGGNAPYQGDAPPPDRPTATRDPADGNWYVMEGGTRYMVVQ